ncbi:hypothetical protein DFAR_990005 [Desulfarculales bacterium]
MLRNRPGAPGGRSDHGTKQAKMLWTSEVSRFTLLFEQAAMTLVREMPVLAATRIIGVSGPRPASSRSAACNFGGWSNSTWPKPCPK